MKHRKIMKTSSFTVCAIKNNNLKTLPLALALAALAINLLVIQPASGGSFATNSPLHIPRYAHTATLLLNGKLLVAGGQFTASAELYDPATGTSTTNGVGPL